MVRALAHAIRSTLGHIFLKKFYGKVMRKAKNWKYFSQTRPIYIVTVKFQNGVIFLRFWKYAINYVAKSFIDGIPIFERFESFGTTLINTA